MSKKAFSDAKIDLMKALGIAIENGQATCSGRPGVVYIRQDGKLRPLAHDPETMKPLQLKCEHDALELIEQFYLFLFVQGMQSIMQDKDMPKAPSPDAFRYAFTDEEPEVKVTHTHDADDVIAHIKEKL